jgi:hypothetical protein
MSLPFFAAKIRIPHSIFNLLARPRLLASLGARLYLRVLARFTVYFSRLPAIGWNFTALRGNCK